MKIQFLGAAREVTGSKHLITTDKGIKILLDCGMFQGKGLETDAMNRDLGFEPADIDYLLLSHAHIDHSGLIPYIYKNGFRGTIICTPATRDLCAIMLADSGNIQEHDTIVHNKKRAKNNLPPLLPIFTLDDAHASMQFFISVPYNKEYFIDSDIKVLFTDAGHILGSSAVNITIKDGEKTHRICFTGDIGRYNTQIIKDPQPFPQADYIITESTYGDRLHQNLEDAEKELLKVVIDCCTKKKGKLIIPSFSIGRSQEIVYALDRLKSQNLLPDVDVYVDSPLSTDATNIMRMHPECFNNEILEYMKTNTDPFGFKKLHYVQSVEQSKALNSNHKPCIIISASGMMEAGRVKHHLANNIENPTTTILVVGYCAPSTLGARISRGDKIVSIFGQKYDVKADVEHLESYSAHGDYEEMTRFLSCQNKNNVKKVFLVHGEIEVQQHYADYLRKHGFNNIEIPELKESFTF
ncbi:MAG: MBL fold metallo-hydrolase [Bacteroidetes bacterium]|nr:MBL fold metallo-hydrolase [Bacteroidota bacterium]